MQHPSDREPTRIDALGIRPPAAFEIEHATIDRGIALLVFRGELDLAAASVMRSRVEAAAGDALVLDLHEVTFIDSSALRELLYARESLVRSGRRVVLAGVPVSVRRILEITGTGELFETAPTRAAALARLSAD
jgi:stage II sporulation protein AA (anti-sigma F factor antagonist)